MKKIIGCIILIALVGLTCGGMVIISGWKVTLLCVGVAIGVTALINLAFKMISD